MELLESGVDPSSGDAKERTALHFAASQGYTSIGLLVLHHCGLCVTGLLVLHHCGLCVTGLLVLHHCGLCVTGLLVLHHCGCVLQVCWFYIIVGCVLQVCRFYIIVGVCYRFVGFTSLWVYVTGLLVLHHCGLFYLTTHSTHFIYGYMTSDIW